MRKVAVFDGDGIGPEITEQTLRILESMSLGIEFRKAPLRDSPSASGISDEAWRAIEECGTVLKAPTATQGGGGQKSLNVALRNALSLYANVRPVRSYHPFVPTSCPGMDLVIVRENGEDLYTGREYRQTLQASVALKTASHHASCRIAAYAFGYASRTGRDRVTCMSKDNIMKITDGMFHRAFREVAAGHPGIVADHRIIDIGSAMVATRPEQFSVIVTTNLYGDIISDIAAQVAGSVGLAGSANVGEEFAMFEAIHGTAPDIAGLGIANPSGMINAAVMMLCHMDLPEAALELECAWLKTLEDGDLTADMHKNTPFDAGYSTGTKPPMRTAEFASAVIANLGSRPSTLCPSAMPGRITVPRGFAPPSAKGGLAGVDIFVDWPETSGKMYIMDAAKLCETSCLRLTKAWSGGRQVHPPLPLPGDLADSWILRFESRGSLPASAREIWELVGGLSARQLDVTSVEVLYGTGETRDYTE